MYTIRIRLYLTHIKFDEVCRFPVSIKCVFVSEDDFGREVPKNELLIESDEDPHINVGSHFQANVELCQKSSHPGKIQSHEDLVWEPAIKHGVMDNEGKKLNLCFFLLILMSN